MVLLFEKVCTTNLMGGLPVLPQTHPDMPAIPLLAELFRISAGAEFVKLRFSIPFI